MTFARLVKEQLSQISILFERSLLRGKCQNKVLFVILCRCARRDRKDLKVADSELGSSKVIADFFDVDDRQVGLSGELVPISGR